MFSLWASFSQVQFAALHSSVESAEGRGAGRAAWKGRAVPCWQLCSVGLNSTRMGNKYIKAWSEMHCLSFYLGC